MIVSPLHHPSSSSVSLHSLPFPTPPSTSPPRSLSFPLNHVHTDLHHSSYFNQFPLSPCFSLLCRFHHYVAATSSALRRPLSGSDWMSGHKLMPQNRSTVHRVFDLILATTPLRATAMAVRGGGRILNVAVLEGVPVAMGVTALYPTLTLSSPPWSSITLLHCSQDQRQVGGGLCCASTEELAQVYFGGYDKEENAARVLKYWGTSTTTNFSEVGVKVVLHLVHVTTSSS